MFHAPSQDSNLKTKSLTLAASLQSNVFNVLKFASPAWIRTPSSGALAAALPLKRKGLQIHLYI
jgi:hypothetical protein